MTTEKNTLYDKRGILREEILDEFSKYGNNVSCECPTHLVALLKQAKEFTKYQENCLIEKPQDETIHEWLKATSINLEHMLSSTIVNLARMEGIIDEENKFVDDD